jgi:hypothetical protein
VKQRPTPQAETHKAEISTNPSPVAVATAENGGDGRERRWRVEILNSESGDGREPASVFCDVSVEWRAERIAENEERKKIKQKKKKNLK